MGTGCRLGSRRHSRLAVCATNGEENNGRFSGSLGLGLGLDPLVFIWIADVRVARLMLLLAPECRTRTWLCWRRVRKMAGWVRSYRAWSWFRNDKSSTRQMRKGRLACERDIRDERTNK